MSDSDQPNETPGETPGKEPGEDPAKEPLEGTVAWDPEELARAVEGDHAAAQDEGPGAAAAASEDDPLVGQLLRGKWRVLERLGAGSFGTVYKVRDEKGGWIEALKILAVDRIQGAEAENARARFLREAQIMKRLGTRSQHIVGLSTYEEDLEKGLVYFLMDFVEGRSLADALLAEGPFGVDRTITLALQICDALIVAHEGSEPVVHRDLKLENIMLAREDDGEEVPKVLDFGIAKLAERDVDSRLTTVGTLGTPGFAAPEQLRAEEVDARTDLFAFGVILYSLLTGRDPWLGNPAGKPTHQIYELMVASDRGEVRPMAEAGVDVPPAMRNVVMRLLNRDPAARFQSASELKAVLERVRAGGGETDHGSLRVVTEAPGVRVQIRSGRSVVAEGPTPCVANGLEAGSYRVQVVDERYDRLDTTVELGPGAIEDVKILASKRTGGAVGGLLRRPGRVAAAAVVVLAAGAAALIQPWGATISLDEAVGLAERGSLENVRVTEDGLEGRASRGPLPRFVRVEVDDAALIGAVGGLRAAGAEVDTSAEVRRLVEKARQAQAAFRYFGSGNDDVRALAERALAIDPESDAARSLLLKVAERMAWDAQAAAEDGEPAAARTLAQECLTLVPDHPECLAAMEAG